MGKVLSQKGPANGGIHIKDARDQQLAHLVCPKDCAGAGRNSKICAMAKTGVRFGVPDTTDGKVCSGEQKPKIGPGGIIVCPHDVALLPFAPAGQFASGQFARA